MGSRAAAFPTDLASTKTWLWGILPQSTAQLNRPCASGVENVWMAVFQPLEGWRPGTYTFTSLTFRLSDTQVANCDAARIVFSTLSAGVLTRQHAVDVYSQITKASGGNTMTVNFSQAITIEQGQSWYVGVELHSPVGRSASTPGIACTPTATNCPSNAYVWSNTGVQVADASAPPATWTTASADIAGTSPVLLGKFTATTTRNTVLAVTSSLFAATAKSILVPHTIATTINEGTTWFQFDDVVCPNSSAITVEFARHSSASPGTAAALVSWVMDMTTTDRNTFAAVNVNLNSTTEAGDNFDCEVLIRPALDGVATRGDLFYCNTTDGQGPLAPTATKDFAVISHAAKSTSSRYAAEPSNSGYSGYSLDAARQPVEWLRITRSSGTGATAIAGLKVCRRLPIGSCASNMGTGGFAPNRLGEELLDLLDGGGGAYKNVARPNNAVLRSRFGSGDVTSDSSPFMHRFKSPTIGQGDIVGMCWNVLFICGDWFGNDLKADSGTDVDVEGLDVSGRTGLLPAAASVPARILECVWGAGEILSQLLNRGNQRKNEVIWIGMAPYNDPGKTAGVHDAAFQRINEAMRGVCGAAGIPYFDPMPLVAGNLATYQDPDGVHYVTAGSEAVAARAVAALNAARAPEVSPEGRTDV